LVERLLNNVTKIELQQKLFKKIDLIVVKLDAELQLV
jgi:hypothetical protein